MREPWFQKWKWVYKPYGWQGWFVLLLVLLYCVESLFIVGSMGSTLGQALFLVAPAFLCGFGMYLWIASKTDDTME